MKETYDRLAAGDRIRLKRTLLGLTQEEMAVKINRATKYYADIERGSCGMSIETLMALSAALDMSMDYIICGKVSDEAEKRKHTEEVSAIIGMLDTSDTRTQQYALNMLKLFFAACKER